MEIKKGIKQALILNFKFYNYIIYSLKYYKC